MDHFTKLFPAKSLENLRTPPYMVFRCQNCGLGVLHPQPCEDELRQYYSEGLYNESSPPPVVDFLMNLFQTERYRALRDLSPGRILDVGCGKGRFLAVSAKHGWNVQGVEPVAMRKKWAQTRYGIHVFLGDLKDLPLPDNYFDVATLWHSLEHMRDPTLVLSQVARKLKVGGRLVVSVPNFNSLQAVFGGRMWFHLDVPRHLFHFTPESLTRILEKEGFEVVKKHTWSLEFNLLGWTETLIAHFGGEPATLSRLIKGRMNFVCRHSWKHNLKMVVALGVVMSLGIPFIGLASFMEGCLDRGGSLTFIAQKN